VVVAAALAVVDAAHGAADVEHEVRVYFVHRGLQDDGDGHDEDSNDAHDEDHEAMDIHRQHPKEAALDDDDTRAAPGVLGDGVTKVLVRGAAAGDDGPWPVEAGEAAGDDDDAVGDVRAVEALDRVVEAQATQPSHGSKVDSVHHRRNDCSCPSVQVWYLAAALSLQHWQPEIPVQYQRRPFA